MAHLKNFNEHFKPTYMDYFKNPVISLRVSQDELDYLNENYETIFPDGVKHTTKDFILEAIKLAVSRIKGAQVDKPETLALLAQAQKDRQELLEALNAAREEKTELESNYNAVNDANTTMIEELKEARRKIFELEQAAIANTLPPCTVTVEFPDFLFEIIQKEAAAQTQLRGKDIQPPHVLFELWLHNVTGTKDYLRIHYTPSELKNLQKTAQQ